MKKRSEQKFPLLVARVSGSEEEMGAQLGAFVREAGGWEASAAYYPRMAERVLGGTSRPARWLFRPVLEWGMRRLARERIGELERRSQAFVRELGLPSGWTRYFQVFDTMQNTVSLAAKLRLGPFRQLEKQGKRLAEQIPPMCSTLVTWGKASDDGSLRHARNFDLPGVGTYERVPMLVFCTPRDGLRYGFVANRAADLTSINAFNEAGIAITTHNRFHRESTWKGAPISDLLHEMIRRARTLAEAEEIVRSMQPIASTWGIAISSASEGRAVSFETTGTRLRVVQPGADEDFLAVTNHYIHPEIQQGELAVSSGRMNNSEGRYRFLRNEAAKGGLDLHQLQALLGSYQDVDVPGTTRATGSVTAQVHSVQSVVIEPDKERVQVSVGPVPTGRGPWATIPWEWSQEARVKVFDFAAEDLPTAPAEIYDEGPQAEAMEAFLEAATIPWSDRDPKEAWSLIDRAVSLHPEEPSYRLFAGGLCLQQGRLQDALAHFRTGLEHERSPYFRGELQLWASRTATALGLHDDAATWRRQLQNSTLPLLQEHRDTVTTEAKKPLQATQLRKTRPQYHLSTLQL